MHLRRLPLLALGLAAVGCGGNVDTLPDSQSGPDADRGGATELFLDKLVDDFVDLDGGDSTDWKFFKVKAKGILTLTVYWDDYRDIDSEVEVRDRFGVLVGSNHHTGELEKDKIELRVEPGTHFVRLHANKGSSVYTIEATFQPFDYEAADVAPTAVALEGGGGDALVGPESGDPIPRAAPQPGTRPPKHGGGPSPRATPRATTPQPEVAAAPSGHPIQANIVSMIPGRGVTTLTLAVGSAQGVQRGVHGYILDDNGQPNTAAAVQVVEANEKSSRAQTNLTPAQIATRHRVVLYVP
jgi:hypothetical protein